MDSSVWKKDQAKAGNICPIMDQSMQQAQVIIKGLGLKRDVTMQVISWSGILALAEVGPG